MKSILSIAGLCKVWIREGDSIQVLTVPDRVSVFNSVFPRIHNVVESSSKINRCSWCGEKPSYEAYHDTEWGIPEKNSKALFKKPISDALNLSWIMILRKRDNCMKAFDSLDPVEVVRYSDAKLEMLMKDPGIARNRLGNLFVAKQCAC